jgi:tRNA C32,U32 (ribose-2'-O)-methylase TrmJ
VLGHEQTGIPPEAVDLLDVAVEIPMVGSGASLNVAVAGSLVLYRLAGFLWCDHRYMRDRTMTWAEVAERLSAKYTRPQDRQYLPDADPGFDVLYALRPRSALAWRLDDYQASQRGWTFGS